MEDIKVDWKSLTIGFIGGGNMAKAICEGIVKKGNRNNQFSNIYVIIFTIIKYFS